MLSRLLQAQESILIQAHDAQHASRISAMTEATIS